MIKVLYDGWSLVYQPNSPEALHVLTLLEQHPQEVQAILALPGEPPEWLPEWIDSSVQLRSGTARSRLAWEQRRIPGLLRQESADLLHLTAAHPPMFGSGRTVLSPAEPFEDAKNMDRVQPRSLRDRLRISASVGGMSGLRSLFWPIDLSSNAPVELKTPVYYLTAEPLLNFISDKGDQTYLDLPESYILCPAPGGEKAVQRLLQAWSWAAGPIGEYYPLLIFGFEPGLKDYLDRLIETHQLRSSVRLLSALPPRLILGLFKNAAAVFHPAPAAAWGGFMRLALRSGKPLVAADSPLTEALVGPAAYLAPGDDPRALGAGLITLIVEESVSQRLSEQALIQAAAWEAGDFRRDLYAAYRVALS